VTCRITLVTVHLDIPECCQQGEQSGRSMDNCAGEHQLSTTTAIIHANLIIFLALNCLIPIAKSSAPRKSCSCGFRVVGARGRCSPVANCLGICMMLFDLCKMLP